MLWTLTRLVTDEEGVTAVEYGLIAALIAVVIIVAVAALGTSLSSVFSLVASTV
ncbi:MAG TPA: Flp family type IVb pilin [Stellaceae bacterium]